MDENGLKARSFRYEDYNTRRVFLRSYPLHWGAESEADESIGPEVADKCSIDEPEKVSRRTSGKRPVKKIVVAVVQWGEKRILVFRRFKHKVTIFVVSCVPVNFKAPTALISVI